MLRIRLRRAGAKKRPFYQVVVSDSHKTPRSAFVDMIGHYDPNHEPSKIDIDREKADAWIAKGAKPSGTVAKLLRTVETA